MRLWLLSGNWRNGPVPTVIHDVDQGLALLDQLQFTAAVAVARDVNGHRPVIPPFNVLHVVPLRRLFCWLGG
ncbi:MAG: hypothetical protein ACI853_001942 [Paracoccaceae bacterium]|jgi:hypothetical protein